MSNKRRKIVSRYKARYVTPPPPPHPRDERDNYCEGDYKEERALRTLDSTSGLPLMNLSMSCRSNASQLYCKWVSLPTSNE